MDIQSVFRETFGFTHERLELWEGSFFEESGGTLVDSLAFKDLNENRTFVSYLEKAVKEKLILKISGKMNVPVDIEAFIVCFLKSEDRWGMPHVFYDTPIDRKPITDILWESNDKGNLVDRLLDHIHYLTAVVFDQKRRIIDRMTIAVDFPDEKTIKDKGILLYYLGGPESRILRNLIRGYSRERKEDKSRVSLLNINNLTNRLYSDPFFDKVWTINSKGVRAIPGGSLALISDEKDGIPKLLKGIERDVVKPFVENIPPDLYDVIMLNVKARKKLDEDDN